MRIWFRAGICEFDTQYKTLMTVAKFVSTSCLRENGFNATFVDFDREMSKLNLVVKSKIFTNQSCDILQRAQNRLTGDR